MRWKRLRRITAWSLGVLLLATGALVVGLRFYLSSHSAVDQVAARLQTLLGGSVHVGGAHIGLVGDSTLHNLKVFESDDRTGRPWLALDDVEADVSAVSALHSSMPSHIDVTGARVVLHFDRDGKLLTRLPAGKGGGPIPHFHVARGQLTIIQQGRPPFVLEGITADVGTHDQGIHVDGTVHDPVWGDWDMTGDFVTGQKIALHMHTGECRVTMPMLTAVPFVPANVWKQVHLDGTTPADVTIAVPLGPEKQPLHYRVELAPRQTHLEIPSIDLETEDTSGQALIEDGKVTLDRVKGRYGDGTISTDAVLDFTKPTIDLHFFNLHVENIMLHHFPRTWRIPAGVDGKLSGAADLHVLIAGGKVKTRGNGEGLIENPKIPLVHVKKPIRFYLLSDEKGFHFRHQLQRTPTNESAGPLKGALSALEADLHHLGSLPTRLTEQVVSGLDWLLEKPPVVARRTVHYFWAPPAAAAAGRQEPTYLEVDVNLDSVRLEELISRLKLQLPYSIAGTANVQSHLAIPINRPQDLKLYRFQGQATFPTLRVADVALSNVRTGLDYSGGILKLQKVQGEIPGPQRAGKTRDRGTFQGSARLAVVPLGPMSLKASVEKLPADVLAGFVPGLDLLVSGGLSGTIEARVPLPQARQPAAWEGSAHLGAPRIDIAGVPLTRPEATVEVTRGTARLSRFSATLGGADLVGSGTMELAGKMAYDAEVHVARINREALGRLAREAAVPVEMKGPIEASAQVKGTVHPFVLNTEGTIQTGPLGVSGAQIDSLRLKWKGDERKIRVPTLEARLYDGKITGSAVLPVSSSEAGSASLRLDDIRLRKIAERMGGLPFRVDGILSGNAEATISAATENRPRQVKARLEVDSPELRVQGVPATNVRGTVGYRSGEADYRLEGNSLGGRITLQGKTPIPLPAGEPQGPEVPGGEPPRRETRAPGRLDVRGVRLRRLWPYLRLEERLGPLTGGFSLSLPFDLGPGARPTGTGRFELTGLRWGGEELAGVVQGNVLLRRGAIQVRNLSGDLGQGSIRGELFWRLGRVGSGWFHLSLEQVDVRRLLVVFPDIRNDVQGAVDADIRGQIGPEWRGTANVVLLHARIFGLEVAQWRLPLGFALSPAEGGGEITVRESTAEIARGRGYLQASLTWGAGLNLRGLLRLAEVDLATLLHSLGSTGSYAAGRVTARIDFWGNQMHSVNDLQANVQARLRDTQALQLPVLRVLTPYLRPGISAYTFQSGALKGRLGNGILRVESLTLASEILELVLVGTVTLTGRLNLDVSTRSGLMVRNTETLQTLGLRVRSLGTLPLTVVTQAAALLANRVVHLRLTGTVRSPVIQVLPGTLLPGEAIRFFLTGASDVSVP